MQKERIEFPLAYHYLNINSQVQQSAGRRHRRPVSPLLM
jgi:hypothetical protein